MSLFLGRLPLLSVRGSSTCKHSSNACACRLPCVRGAPAVPSMLPLAPLCAIDVAAVPGMLLALLLLALLCEIGVAAVSDMLLVLQLLALLCEVGVAAVPLVLLALVLLRA